MAEVQFRSLSGETKETTWDAVFAAAQRLQTYFSAVNLLFVERSEVLRRIKYAMTLREHVLMDGPTGAAKSMLIDTVFQGIEGAKVWGMDLTRFTSEAQLFGSYDVIEMRKSGHLVHMTEGSMAEAHFAKTGEFFDASDATLRTLLGALNERRIARGPQIIRLPLITTIADTNFAPDSLGNRQGTLQAVIDRFLFRTRVGYVVDPDNRLRMLKMALDADAAPTLPSLSLEDIELVSGTVRGMNMVDDPYVVEAYNEMVTLYKNALQKATRPEVSDRRFMRAVHIMEAHALLDSRKSATFDDLEVTRYVLCQTDQEEELLKAARAEAIAKWAQKAARREIDQERFNLSQFTDRIPSLDVATLGTIQLDQMVVDLETLRMEMSSFTADSLEVGTLHVQAGRRINELLAQAELRMMDLCVENLPTKIDGSPPELLPQLKQQAERVRNRLQSMRPRSDVAIVKHAEALERVLRTISEIQVEFTSVGSKEGG